jgi:C4-dicarboxylate-specific signal transduction histidine kinase
MTTSSPALLPSPAAIVAYAAAILSVGMAAAASMVLDSYLHAMPYVSLFLCAVMFVAWFGGLGPSVVAASLATLLFAFYFVAPAQSFKMAASDALRVGLFAMTAICVVSISAAQRRAAALLLHARDQLQAAVQELARLNGALQAENAQRRRVETYLDEAQRLSHTGSFSWRPASGDFFWSKEAYRMMAFGGASDPTLEQMQARVHKDDLEHVRREIDRLRRGERDCEYEYRWLTASGAFRHHHVRAQRVRFESGEEEIVGALMDVTEAHKAEEALHAAQTALAHATQVATLGEMSASIAHEVNQPLAGIVINGEAALRWLNRPQPELGEVRSAIERMVRDGRRAGEVIDRIRALVRRAPVPAGPVDLNEVITEAATLVQRELQSQEVSLQLGLARDLPQVVADRVELQQVVINLMMNGMQAMASVTDRPRQLAVCTTVQSGEVLVAVRDAGMGVDPAAKDRLFSAFFTTRKDGMGMGLSICRSIIEAQGGRIWASSNDGPGMTFQFALPAPSRAAS